MISINAICKRYGKLTVLNNVNLSLEGPAVYALVGPNACGKTTIMKTILGHVMADSGDIFVEGENITNQCEYRSKIGYMPQLGRYPANLSISQLVDMVKDLRMDSGPLDMDLMNAYKIKDLGQKKMNTLSGGTTQKISAALAFMFSPPILILDEPTAGLDPVSAEILKDKIIKEKENGKLIIITTHLLTELNEVVDHIAFMNEGSIKFSKPKDQILKETNSSSLSKAFVQYLKNTESI